MGYRTNDVIALRPSGFTLDEVRSKLSGLHFSKECLSDGELEILSLAESLLSVLDADEPTI